MSRRLNIYIDDDLERLMDDAKVNGSITWSTIAQTAFRETILQRNIEKGIGNMESVIERLKIAKERDIIKKLSAGNDAGISWAKAYAGYDELVAIADLAGVNYDINSDTVARAAIGTADPENVDIDSFWDGAVGDEVKLTDEFVKGFVAGAAAVWAEVKDKI